MHDGIFTPAYRILTYAKQFSKAASVIVNCGQASKTRIAVTYLYGHAIELALKSILVKHGVAQGCLKDKIRHDLEKALKKAVSSSYPESGFFDDKLREIVDMLNPIYGKKHLEYHPGPAYMRLPSETCMQETVDNLIGKLDCSYQKEIQ